MTLSSSLKIASGGLSAQSERMKMAASNVANANTPNYIRKIPVLTEAQDSSFEDVMGSIRKDGVFGAAMSFSPSGVSLAGAMLDPTPGKRVYSPNHPEADKDGYVTMSNSNVVADMADAMSTQRLYEANLAVVGIVKQMANKALEIGRGQ
jgi:flagellar basal-body rod protein FlgC